MLYRITESAYESFELPVRIWGARLINSGARYRFAGSRAVWVLQRQPGGCTVFMLITVTGVRDRVSVVRFGGGVWQFMLIWFAVRLESRFFKRDRRPGRAHPAGEGFSRLVGNLIYIVNITIHRNRTSADTSHYSP
ncbi:MAG: hypothetical protein LBB86_01795 [Oscillospiraceae bacterium]|nr:hypothetical protein [Oscillospiraceae bacterium]